MSEANQRKLQITFFLATGCYLGSLFFPWWRVREEYASSSAIGLRGTLGDLSALLALALLVIAVRAFACRGERMSILLRRVAAALVFFNALAVLVFALNYRVNRAEIRGHLTAAPFVSVALSFLALYSLLELAPGGASVLIGRRSATTANARPRMGLWAVLTQLAVIACFVAIFSPWYGGFFETGWPRALPFVGGPRTAHFALAELVLCYLLVVFALPRRRGSKPPLEHLRSTLAIGLAAVVVVNVFVAIPGSDSLDGLGFWPRAFDWVGYGAWLSLGAVLVLLLALAPEAGGPIPPIERLSAWARLGRLDSSAPPKSRVMSSAEAREKHWSWALVLALCVYLLTIRMSWWKYLEFDDRSTMGVSPLSFGLGEMCTLLAIGTLAFLHATRARGERWRTSIRNALVSALGCLSFVSFLLIWRGIGIHHARLDYGSYVALASLLIMALAAIALSGGPDIVTIARSRGLQANEEGKG